MTRIFDNLIQDSKLLPALQDPFALSSWAYFCAVYLNLRGWGSLASHVDQWEPGRRTMPSAHWDAAAVPH